MTVLEQVLVGILVLLLLLWARPGIRAALRQGREARTRDWPAVVFVAGVVVLFVLLLILLVRG